MALIVCPAARPPRNPGKCCRWLPFLLLLLALAGCGGAPAPTGSARLPTRAATETRPAPTLPPAPTATPGPTATAEPTRTPTLPQPTRPALADDPAAYQLATPDARALFDLAYWNDQQMQQLIQQSRDTSDAEAFQKSLDRESQFYYASGVPGARFLLEERRVPGMEDGYVPLAYQQDRLLDAIFDDLTFRKVDLNNPDNLPQNKAGNDNQIIEPVLLEFDGDPGREWLLNVYFRPSEFQYGSQSWLAVDELPGPQYNRLALPIPVYGEYTGTLQYAGDMTGDTRPDLIISEKAPRMHFVSILVFEGTSTGFQKRFQYDFFPFSAGYSPESGTRQTIHALMVENGQPVLTITSDYSFADRFPDCRWTETRVVRWPGGVEQETITSNLPDAPHCLVAWAAAWSSWDSISPDRVRGLYDRALARIDVSNPEQVQLALKAHLALAVVDAHEQREAQARSHITQALALPLEAEQKQAILDAFDRFRSGPIRAFELCGILEHPATPLIPAMVGPCQWDSITDLLLQLGPGYPGAPEQAVTAAGLPIHTLLRYPITGSTEPATLVITSTQPALLLGYLPGENGWEWRLLMMQQGPPVNILREDKTADGLPEMVIVFPLQATRECGGMGFPTGFLGPVTGFDLAFLQTDLCAVPGQPPDEARLLADTDGDGRSDLASERFRQQAADFFAPLLDPARLPWQPQPGAVYRAEEVKILTADALEELGYGLYAGQPPAALRARLEACLASGCPLAPARLRYLIALSVEREGNPAEAARRYWELARDPDAGLWGSLAALKLRK